MEEGEKMCSEKRNGEERGERRERGLIFTGRAGLLASARYATMEIGIFLSQGNNVCMSDLLSDLSAYLF